MLVKHRLNTEKVGTIVPGAGLDLDFQHRGRGSVYVALLEQLRNAPPGSVLKCENARVSRYSVGRAAKKLGYTVAYAECDGHLYVKVEGVRKPAEATVKPADVTAQNVMMRLLVNRGPCTLKEIARNSGVTTAICAEILTQLAARELVECEDGVYRVKGPRKVA